MKHRLVILLLMTAAGAIAAYAVGVSHATGARTIREALLQELKTVTLSNCTLKRYGSAHDGGYLMCENLMSGVQSAYSYGISTEDNWGCEVSRKHGVAVHQYDCFTPQRPVCEGGRFMFHDECVGPKAATLDGQPFDTFLSQIARNGDAAKNLLVKIDIEGAEWDSLIAMPDSMFDSISQMPMELHGTDEPKILETIRRLKRKFHLVNVHFNNWACTSETAPLPAAAYQVLWVNKKIGVIDPDGPSPAPMSALNAVDGPGLPDCQLK
jgi:hypothetical protein